MHRFAQLLFLQLLLPLLLAAQAPVNPDWLATRPPFRIADNLYYVGGRDLASYLVTTPDGLILINANIAASPAQIRASVELLGFRWDKIKILLNSQAHVDHVGGAAQIVRETHARNYVMEGDADVVASGGATDFAFGPKPLFTPAPIDRILHDGSQVSLGGVVLVAHKTAGHTRGCTTWTLKVHLPGEPADKLRDVVIAGGFMALSEYRLVARKGQPTSYPGIVQDFRKMFADLRRLPCDIFLGAHGAYFNMEAKLAKMPELHEAVWIDPTGYLAKIKEAETTFNEQLKQQQAALRRR